MKIKFYITVIVSFAFFITALTSYADESLISLFPLNNYDQTLSTWIKPTDADYDKPLISAVMQQKRLAIFYDHYFGAHSPWNADYVNQVLMQQAPNDLKTTEQNLLMYFSNQNKTADQIGYGENFRPYTDEWINTLANNINIAQFDGLSYQVNNRGIAIDNLQARILPTDDVHFYDYKLAGQGYPFDNLQMSALWVGTPVYIISETQDHAWMLVITPDYIGWVKSNGIARADNTFINTWTSTAKHKLAAMTRTKTGIVDTKGNFLFSAYVGSVFPVVNSSGDIQIMVPSADADHHAIINNVIMTADNAALMPLSATPHHFSIIMNTLVGRPYGWGGLYFYNDCSAELKSVLTPFGIWVPRHSSDQVTVGKMVDMTAATPDNRLSYLMQHGKKFLTLVYIGSHVVMYIGNEMNPNQNNALMAMTYQNIWGLSPNPAIRRAVIGKSVLLPLLLQYPEDPSLISLAAKKYFQVGYLDQLPSNNALVQQNTLNIKSLMSPDDHLL